MSRIGKGKVYLVGAGPGDPGLITLRGAECVAVADVVLYDALVNPRLLELAPTGAERRLVGKRHGRVTVSQEEIERLLVEHAVGGRTVVRLKGGDPFVFGRGGEEAEACRAAGVDFEVVPGVTSAVAVPAYAGIPVTHRDHASSVTIVTARPGDASTRLECNWTALASVGGTLVFVMAMLRLHEVTENLRSAGMDDATPAAVIRWGTTPRQTIVKGTLADIAAKTDEIRLRPPVTVVVGAVAALADTIAWYERLPLFGRRVVVTRARRQAAALGRLLEAAGAEVIEYPVIEIVEPADPAAVEEAYRRVSDYDWLVLTSANGAECFFKGFLASGRDIRDLAGVRIASIGSATSAVIARHGVRVAAEPGEYRAEALLEALGAVDGQRILLARAERAREVLPRELAERGARVDVVALYRTVLPTDTPPIETLGQIDMIIFTSSSTVTNFERLAGGKARALLGATALAAIGPVTAATLARLGVSADVVANPYTVEALADAIVAHFAKG